MATNFEELKANARTALDTAVVAYNAAIRGKDMTAKEAAEKACADAIEDYNDASRTQFCTECCATEKPLLTAVTKLEYPTVRVVDKKPAESANVRREVIETETCIKMGAFQKFATENVGIPTGVAANWLDMNAKFAQLLTYYACNELGINPKEVADTYYIRKIANDIDMGKTPTSKTSIQKQLQMVVSAMIGDEYKVTSHDAAYMRMLFCKKSRKTLSAIAGNINDTTALVAQVCHRIVTEASYKIEYRHAKTTAKEIETEMKSVSEPEAKPVPDEKAA